MRLGEWGDEPPSVEYGMGLHGKARFLCVGVLKRERVSWGKLGSGKGKSGTASGSSRGENT